MSHNDGMSRGSMLLPDTSRAFGCPQRYIQGPV